MEDATLNITIILAFVLLYFLHMLFGGTALSIKKSLEKFAKDMLTLALVYGTIFLVV